jgi:hypothetical protein
VPSCGHNNKIIQNYQGVVMTLTKAELADLLFEKVGLNKRARA